MAENSCGFDAQLASSDGALDPPQQLLNGDDGADWNFGKEFSRRFTGQTNATVRRGIVRHDALMHSEIETAQPHEIRHIDVINSRTVIAFFVGDHEIAALG